VITITEGYYHWGYERRQDHALRLEVPFPPFGRAHRYFKARHDKQKKVPSSSWSTMRVKIVSSWSKGTFPRKEFDRDEMMFSEKKVD